MADRNSLLVITSSFPRWPGDTAGCFVHALAERLAETCDVTVLAPGDTGALPRETMGRMTVYRHRQGFGPKTNLAYGSGIPANIRQTPWKILFLPFYLLFLIKAIHVIVRQSGIDVIHAHWLLPSGLAAILYKYFLDRRMRVLITAHGSDILRFNGRVGRWLKRRVLKHADAVTVVSAPLVDIVRALGYMGPLTIGPMGVDTTLFSPDRKAALPEIFWGRIGCYLLFVGSVIKSKGIGLLIDAMPRVHAQYPDMGLIVIGEGHDKAGMADRVRHLGLETSIRFIGAVSHANLPPWYAGAEALVLPSYSEGYGLVVMEALSSGIVPIVSPLPVFHEIQAECPCLVLMRDWSAEAVAEAVTGVLKDKERSRQQGRQAREYAVRNLDWKVLGDHYREVLQSLIQDQA